MMTDCDADVSIFGDIAVEMLDTRRARSPGDRDSTERKREHQQYRRRKSINVTLQEMLPSSRLRPGTRF